MTDQDKDTIIQLQRDIISLMTNPAIVVNPNLRDQFAMAALTAIASPNFQAEDVAEMVYEIADAMLAAREKKK